MFLHFVDLVRGTKTIEEMKTINWAVASTAPYVTPIPILA